MIAKKSVSIIGAGKVGSTLARFLKHKGWNITTIISLTYESAKRLSDVVDADSCGNYIIAKILESEIILIAVPDNQIHIVAENIFTAINDTEIRPAIIHTSGINTSDELLSFKKIGCKTFSFHPIQTFFDKNMEIDLCENIGVGIEGEDIDVQFGFDLAIKLGWKPLRITKTDKPLYHTACVFASNYVTTLASVSSELIKQSSHFEGDAQEYILPIMNSALQALQNLKANDALTGPISRVDIATINTHIHSLKNNRDVLNLYCELGKQTTQLAFSNNKITVEQYTSLKNLFESAKEI